MTTIFPTKPDISNIHVLFLTRSISFPNGTAPTQRVKLLARSLIENGMEVSVLCTQVSEPPASVENISVMGTEAGISYEYTPGTTIRSDHFWTRRWNEVRGIFVAIYRLVELKNKLQPCCVYYYSSIMVNDPVRWIFYFIIRLLNLPLVIDMSERPWSLAQERKKGLALFSPLWGIQGVVVISDFLQKWAEQENKWMKKNIKILKIPILVDINEQTTGYFPLDSNNVLFAGSCNYDKTIQFIFDAMEIVWESHPECILVITGCRSSDQAGEIITKMIRSRKIEDRVHVAGYLSREDLFQRYSQAGALLIPLFDDVRSKARFPTKLGEYMASSRPIVTNNVGEVAHYFIDKKNAYICEPGDISLYSQKIVKALENREEATRIGAAGRQIGEKCFHYQVHAQRFVNLIKLLTLGD